MPLKDAAEAGVRIDDADRSASAGKQAVVGVVRDGSLGLVEIGIVADAGVDSYDMILRVDGDTLCLSERMGCVKSSE